MKKQFLNSHFGNKKFGKKAFIFALDAAMAMIIAIILLTAAHYYVIKSEENILPKLQPVRIGSDIVTVLDNQNLLPFTDEEKLGEIEENLEKELEDLLPKNYDMKIEIDYKCECSDEVSESDCKILKQSTICENTFPIGNELPTNVFIASSHRFFVRITTIEFNDVTYPNTLYYGKARYWIWLK